MARKISKRIGVPHVELDEVFWQPDWVEKPLDEFRAEVTAIIDRHTDGWVIDGNYGRVRNLTLPHADTVIWLRPSFGVAFWRLLKRTVERCVNSTELWGTNHESWRKAFLSRDSLLLYQVRNWRRYSKRITHSLETIPHRASVIQLRSQREIDEFLFDLERNT